MTDDDDVTDDGDVTDSGDVTGPGTRRRRARALREFLDTEVAGAVVLLVAVVVALVWANSSLSSSYSDLWHTELSVSVGWGLDMSMHQVVNDGLMTVFFFVVGLEIKRELVDGELSDPRTAAVPVAAAIGGMVVPALLFVAINASTGTTRGWGIPMATDIAFALGVLAVAGSRLASGAKLFLLTSAVVDDIGAIVVIAVVYSTSISPGALLGAAVVIGMVLLARATGVQSLVVYVLLGVLLWDAMFESGVHATIAGVVLGLITPARGPDSVAERLEHRLHPLSSFVIVPLFALANAGVRLDVGSLSEPAPRAVALGVVVGLVIGKTVGISAATAIAVKTRIGRLPDGVGAGEVIGMAMVAGIGFTVSLFVTELAFDDPAIRDAAKTAVLVASVVAAVAGGTTLWWRGRRTAESPQQARTVPDR
ncbi:MAG TPA: Na+/H+ antiporter NhaA [Microthrixaceae bacterium]|nr:Na+/H+ antiporter NhaA [Microthrixaceae bacterium]MCB9402308.1 Na+/H+ antiporter NhaA [Microthrixaceae bacterium]MCO5305391.1 Na+/H+ antiporter NhaA [Microthrixaceae bacterium]HMV74429.1 Na+/H+ antiporter NhaA [Microthrixaceae bacterium]HMX08160.1 Na+/H+ antiporter NhaA [Microthrixaceae bacterium]